VPMIAFTRGLDGAAGLADLMGGGSWRNAFNLMLTIQF
jgi:hypothetical protein